MKGLSLIIDNNETNNNIPCFLLKRNEKGGKVGSSSSKERRWGGGFILSINKLNRPLIVVLRKQRELPFAEKFDTGRGSQPPTKAFFLSRRRSHN